MDHVLAYAKAYAALVGSVATALLGIYTADSQLGKVLTVVAAVCSAVAVARIPNTPATERGEDGVADVGLLFLVLTFVGVVLLLFGVRFR